MANDPRHDALTAIAGEWTGTVRLWLKPTSTPTEDPIAVSARRAADGQALALEYTGAHGDDKVAGIAIIGYDVNTGRHAIGWLDSFHTGTALMVSEGEPKPGALVDVTTTYGGGDEPWGWRTKLATEGDALVWTMYNSGPGIPEYLAFEARLTRR
jgi:hypothetical protein